MTGRETGNLNNMLLMQARFLRRCLRRQRQSLHYGKQALANSPVLFANSFPKSGTHLLTQVLAGFSRIGPAVDSGMPAIVTFNGETGRQRPVAEILADFQRLLPGDIAYGHIHATPETVGYLCQDGYASYFILRDPRDVAVSHVHYLTGMATNHIHHRYYQEVLMDFDERLQTSIHGISSVDLSENKLQPAEIESLFLPDIRARFEPYTGWLEYPEILVLHFEDFIANRQETIGQAFEHALQRGFQPEYERDKAIELLAQGINPARSPTFRSGKIGGWRDAFSEKHKQSFKRVAGDLLVRLGYETDHTW